MDEERELNMDFTRLMVIDVEALVRKKATSVELRGNWVRVLFASGDPSRADMWISFKKW